MDNTDPQGRKKRNRASRQERGYDADWYRLQAEHLAKHPVCVWLNPDGTPCGKAATQADHIRPFDAKDPLSDPLRLDPNNLQSLCIVCHAKKTAEDQRAKSKPGPKAIYTPEERADRERERSRRFREQQTRTGQEIGSLPEVKNWARREACLADPEKFLREYFGFWPYFYKPFCRDHLKVIEKGEDALRNGGNFAIAEPRGHGKTTKCRGLSIRGLAYGFRQFGLFVGAASGLARRSLNAIKKMMVESKLFREDFPEITFSVLALGGSINRQKGQMCCGQPTGVIWSNEYLRFPRLPAQPSMRDEQHKSGGAILFPSGILGSAITGLNIDGIRPDLVVWDDPQTRESAMKDSACQKREEIIDATVTGLAAPGRRLACFMPLTVIRENDLADRYLNHTLHPEWAIERTAILHSFPSSTRKNPEQPSAMELWEHNAEIRRNYNPHAGPDDKARAAREATEHYIDNQAAMDDGAVASWEDRYFEDEVSAIQMAMNMHADNRRSFFAEMMNKPLPPEGFNKKLTADEICGKLSGVAREVVPLDCSVMTAFIDVQKKALYWIVCGWKEDFTGYVIDYGTYPKQGRPYFTLSDISTTLERFLDMKGAVEEAPIRKGLENLTTILMTREWSRENQQPQKIDFMLIDSGKWSTMVYEFCRRSQFSPRVLPSKGIYFGAGSKKATGEGTLKPGDKAGWHWSLPAAKDERGVKLMLYDTNPYKSLIHKLLATSIKSPGALSLFGRDPSAHRMLADHLLAEQGDNKTSERTSRTVEEWTPKVGEPDNHFLDCLAGAAVAAGAQGVALDGVFRSTKPKPRGPRKTIDQIKAERAAARREKVGV